MESVGIFRNLINPALQQAYLAVGGGFLDVTDATGAYIPLSQTVSLAPYGRIPTAVATVCELTYYCRLRVPHPTTSGYRVIADLIVATLPRTRDARTSEQRGSRLPGLSSTVRSAHSR